MERKEFQAESKRLLELMIHSIYTHKEIFLREILSNASDAIDKLCYRSLTDEQVGMKREDFAITIRPDQEARTLTVSDNGIGMNDTDLEQNLGVIASSGTFQFRQELDKDAETDVIGQFGVGFYSAFMVADHITVVTRKYGDEQGWRWESDGVEGYTIEPCRKDTVGTDIIMHLKADEEPEEYSQYLQEHTLQRLVKKYSDYIRFPIRMEMTRSKRKEGCPEDKPEYEEIKEWETLNSMVPLWQRKKSEVTREEYEKFYQEHFGDFAPPQSVITVSAEGAVTYKALLFIPSQPSGQYYTEDFEPGLQLYSSGVMIMENCEDLLPEHFRFVRGIVDSQDLSLNISREMLQHNRQLTIIARNIEKKIKSELKAMLDSDREKYEEFYAAFGRQLKYGAVSDYGAHKDNLKDLLLFWSSKEGKNTTLEAYQGRMAEEQPYYYYACGESVDKIAKLPQVERILDKGYEILYCTEDVDDFVMKALGEVNGKQFKSVSDEDALPQTEEEKKAAEEKAEEGKPVLEAVKVALGDQVKEVRLSKILKSGACCLSADGPVSLEMERYMRKMEGGEHMKAERVLELNADSAPYAALKKAVDAGDQATVEKYAKLLYGQALLLADLPLEDPAEYAQLVSSLMA